MSRADRRAAGRVAKLPYVANATGTDAAEIRAAATQVNDLLDKVIAEVRPRLRDGWDDEVATSWLAAELAKAAGPEGNAVLAAAAVVRLARKSIRGPYLMGGPR